MQSVVPEDTKFDLTGRSDLQVVCILLASSSEVFELKDFVNEGRCPKIEGSRLSVHKAAHHYETQHNLEEDKDVVDQVHRQLVRVLYALNDWYYAEGDYEENGENSEGDQLWEL